MCTALMQVHAFVLKFKLVARQRNIKYYSILKTYYITMYY